MKRLSVFGIVFISTAGCALAHAWDIDENTGRASGADGSSTSGEGGNVTRDGGQPTDGGGPLPGTDSSTPIADVTPIPMSCNPEAPECERVVFATSDSFFGHSFVGLGGADAKCQEAADKSRHPRVISRKFIAWISKADLTARTRLVPGTGKYILPNGRVVANNFDQIVVTNQLTEPITENEDGGVVTGLAWTGTLPNGAAAPETCGNNWARDTDDGRTGAIGAKDGTWTSAETNRCNTTRHLYCFER